MGNRYSNRIPGQHVSSENVLPEALEANGITCYHVSVTAMFQFWSHSMSPTRIPAHRLTGVVRISLLLLQARDRSLTFHYSNRLPLDSLLFFKLFLLFIQDVRFASNSNILKYLVLQI